ncbi:EF-hand domain-containing protein [Undibacterium sp. JH2W]|uniref:EF-hand domain-containing protein n=1 Tax=Undibacterium sp. JH2W TaxID=3413037 RepID=UPI003BEF615B
MSSITGLIGSSNSYSQQTGSTQRRERDTSKIADNVFSKLDTKNQGYLEVQDLETAFSNIAGNSTSSTNTATSSTASNSPASTDSSNNINSSINDLFKKLDSNGDGKLTKSEFSDGIKKLSDALEGQFHARRTRGAESSRPPPPPEGGGLDKAQLTDLSAKVAQSNSSAGAALSQVAQNFDAADTNQDGKVSLQETLAYLEKSIQASSTGSTSGAASSSAADSGNTGTTSTTGTSDTSTASSTSSSSTDAALFKKALQLLRAYHSPATASAPSIAVSA